MVDLLPEQWAVKKTGGGRNRTHAEQKKEADHEHKFVAPVLHRLRERNV